jgi:hypothetical protein
MVEKTNSKWYHKLNRWLGDNLSALNAIIFLIFVIGGALGGVAVGLESSRYGGGELIAFGGIGGLLAGTVVGIMYCGIFALLLNATHDLTRIADAAEKRA